MHPQRHSLQTAKLPNRSYILQINIYFISLVYVIFYSKIIKCFVTIVDPATFYIQKYLDCYLNSIKKSIEDPEVYVRKIAEKEKRISWHLYVMLMIG